MKHLMLIAVMAMGGVLSLSQTQQETDIPADWGKIKICNLSFVGPSDLKDAGTKGVDSCVAQFANKQLTVYLDYGRYGSPFQENNPPYFDITKQSLSVDGKSAQVVTFIHDNRVNSDRKYFAFLYVEVKESDSVGMPKTISLMMSVAGDAPQDQETAKRIFRSIRFE